MTKHRLRNNFRRPGRTQQTLILSTSIKKQFVILGYMLHKTGTKRIKKETIYMFNSEAQFSGNSLPTKSAYSVMYYHKYLDHGVPQCTDINAQSLAQCKLM